MYDLFFGSMLGDLSLRKLDPMDVVFSSPSIDASMEIFRVRITVLEGRQSRALTLSSSLQNRKAEHPLF